MADTPGSLAVGHSGHAAADWVLRVCFLRHGLRCDLAPQKSTGWAPRRIRAALRGRSVLPTGFRFLLALSDIKATPWGGTFRISAARSREGRGQFPKIFKTPMTIITHNDKHALATFTHILGRLTGTLATLGHTLPCSGRRYSARKVSTLSRIALSTGAQVARR